LKGKKEEGEMFFEEKGRRKVVGPFEGGSKDKKVRFLSLGRSKGR
jgi:hypothetical protein